MNVQKNQIVKSGQIRLNRCNLLDILQKNEIKFEKEELNISLSYKINEYFKKSIIKNYGKGFYLTKEGIGLVVPENKKEFSKICTEINQKNKEKTLKYNNDYQKKHKEKYKEYFKKYRACRKEKLTNLKEDKDLSKLFLEIGL